MSIYLKIKNKPRSIESLIKKLYSYKRAADIYKSCTTYKDEACTIIECHRGKNRSFEAIYELATTYFPNAKEKDVVKAIVDADLGYSEAIYMGGKFKPVIFFCPDIQKPVVYYSTWGYRRGCISPRKGVSDKSWVQLLRKINITSAKKLTEYLNR